jgi:hypothetical protein
MKRFFKVFSLLIVSLFLLVSGLDATLDHINRSTLQSRYTVYDERGAVVAAYTGDLRFCKLYVKPVRPIQTEYIHRS